MVVLLYMLSADVQLRLLPVELWLQRACPAAERWLPAPPCCRFPGDDIPIVRGSALAALKGENDKIGK